MIDVQYFIKWWVDGRTGNGGKWALGRLLAETVTKGIAKLNHTHAYEVQQEHLFRY